MPGMWTLPPAPDGFTWRHVGGPDGHGYANLCLSPSGHEVAAVVQCRGVWAVRLGINERPRRLPFRLVYSRSRAIAWAARWAAPRRERLMLRAVGPLPDPSFSLTAPPPPRFKRSSNALNGVF